MYGEAELTNYLNGYKNFYDGQYNIDIPHPILKKEFIKDLNTQISKPETFLIKQPNGLLISKSMGWDTQYFGYPVHKLDYLFTTNRKVAGNLLHQYTEELNARQVKYAFVRVKADDLLVQNALTANSFELMMHKVMLRLPLPDLVQATQVLSENISIRPYRSEDEEFVLRVTSQNLSMNRFTADVNINQELVSGIYLSWIKNLVNASSDAVLVAEFNGQPAGMVAMSKANALYDTDKFPEYPMGFISLVAVEENFRGKAIGKSLIRAATQHFYQKGFKVVFANTALQNTSSLFMFQQLGFQVFSMVSEYRIWLD